MKRLDLIRGDTRIADVPFDARAGRFYMLTRAQALRNLPTMKLLLRLVAVEGDGDRTIAEVTTDHTRSGHPI